MLLRVWNLSKNESELIKNIWFKNSQFYKKSKSYNWNSEIKKNCDEDSEHWLSANWYQSSSIERTNPIGHTLLTGYFWWIHFLNEPMNMLLKGF